MRKASILLKQEKDTGKVQKEKLCIKKVKNEIKLVEIPVKDITDPLFHDRGYPVKLGDLAAASIEKRKKLMDQIISFDKEIAALAENIKAYGLINPIAVQKVGDKTYRRIAGYRRVLAYWFIDITGEKKIPCIVFPVSDDTALALMLSENIQRKDLGEYTKIVSQAEYLKMILGYKNLKELFKFLQRINNYRLGNISKLSSEEIEKMQKAEKVIQELTGKSIRSFLAKISVLNMHPVIIEAIKRNNWSYTTAIELNKLVSAGKIEDLKSLIKEAEEKGYGYAIISLKVKEILGKKREIDDIKPIFKKIEKKISKLDKDKKLEVLKLLKQIENLLDF